MGRLPRCGKVYSGAVIFIFNSLPVGCAFHPEDLMRIAGYGKPDYPALQEAG